MRLIDADAFSELLVKTYEKAPTEKALLFVALLLKNNEQVPTVAEDYDTGYQDGLEDGLNDIRPQGEWISGKDSCACYWFCSECKMSIPKDTDYQYHFCPWCGADMRGEEE